MTRPTGAQLANRLQAARAEGYRHQWPSSYPVDVSRRDNPGVVTVPASLWARLRDRARLLDVKPRVLLISLLRHYLDHPDLYGVDRGGDGIVLHKQGALPFDVYA